MKIEDLPLCGEASCTHADNMVCFVSVSQTDSPESPLGPKERMISLNRRHSNFDPEAFKRLSDNRANVILGAYEHGDILWYVSEDGAPAGASCPWDGVRVAGLFVSGKRVPKGEKGDKARQLILEQARLACELYTAWSNGYVYDVEVEVFKARYSEGGMLYDKKSDYRHDSPLLEESFTEMYFTAPDARKHTEDAINASLARL